MGVKTVAEKLETLMEALNDGATPVANKYFDHVWVGLPKKIPQGGKRVCIIEASNSPDFYYSTCATATNKDTLFYITIISSGTVEAAHKDIYNITDIVEDSIIADPKLGGTVEDCSVEYTLYGDIVDTRSNSLQAASRITLKIRI
jgi:hypothetical protein